MTNITYLAVVDNFCFCHYSSSHFLFPNSHLSDFVVDQTISSFTVYRRQACSEEWSRLLTNLPRRLCHVTHTSFLSYCSYWSTELAYILLLFIGVCMHAEIAVWRPSRLFHCRHAWRIFWLFPFHKLLITCSSRLWPTIGSNIKS